jgi:NAD(P)-dependent dehydrogenase (short-subunit alcohol dehydrogenase family)
VVSRIRWHLFLAEDEARWVTGGTVTVDGGYLAI